MAQPEIRQFPCLSDNYGVLIHDPATGSTAAVDVPEAGPVRAALKDAGWRLTHILITHHHQDHVGGVEELKRETGAEVVGPAGEADKIAGLDRTVVEGDTVEVGSLRATVMETPGHTLGHIVYWFEDVGVLFAADTLFAMGCGRVFEGTMDQMWGSLDKLSRLPEDTVVYAGHEYTASNAKFALSLASDDPAIVARAAEVEALRAAGRPTLPTTIGKEKATNPFIRAAEPAFAARLGLEGRPAAEAFAEIRRRKDNA